MQSAAMEPDLRPFKTIAYRMAGRFARIDADRDDLYQDGMLKLYQALQRTPHPIQPEFFARTVLKRAMGKYYPKKSNTRFVQHGERMAQSPVEYVIDRSAIRPMQEDHAWLNRYFTAVELHLGKEVRWVAETLVQPGALFGEYVLAEVRYKMQDTEVNRRGVAHKVRTSHRQIRQAMGITTTQWGRLLQSLRDFTREWLAK